MASNYCTKKVGHVNIVIDLVLEQCEFSASVLYNFVKFQLIFKNELSKSELKYYQSSNISLTDIPIFKAEL